MASAWADAAQIWSCRNAFRDICLQHELAMRRLREIELAVRRLCNIPELEKEMTRRMSTHFKSIVLTYLVKVLLRC